MSKTLQEVTKGAIDRNWPGAKAASRRSTDYYMQQKEPPPPPVIEMEPESEELEEKGPEVTEVIIGQRTGGDPLAGVGGGEDEPPRMGPEADPSEWESPAEGETEGETEAESEEPEEPEAPKKVSTATMEKENVMVNPRDIVGWINAEGGSTALSRGLMRLYLSQVPGDAIPGGERIPMSEVPRLIEQAKTIDPVSGPAIADKLQRIYDDYMTTVEVNPQLPAPFRPSKGARLGQMATKLSYALQAMGLPQAFGLPQTSDDNLHAQQLKRRANVLVEEFLKAKGTEGESAAREALAEFEAKFGRTLTRAEDGNIAWGGVRRGDN